MAFSTVVISNPRRTVTRFLTVMIMMSIAVISINAQVGIGTVSPDSSAILDMQSVNKGILFPRMNTSQRDSIPSPAPGLQILNTDDYCIDIYNGISWIKNCGYRIDSYDTLQAWIPRQIIPGGHLARTGMTGVSGNGLGYVFGGGDYSSFYNEFWEYDPTQNAWTQRPNLPAAPRQEAVGFSISGKIYIGTGEDESGNARSDFWEYDPPTMQWTQKASLPQGFRYAFAFAINGKGYIGGGYNQNAFYEYNPVTDTWTQKANYPTESTQSIGVSDGTYGYAGLAFQNGPSSMYRYDPIADTWTMLSGPAWGSRSDHTGFIIGNLIVVGAGDSYGSGIPDFWAYDIAQQTWSQISAQGPVGAYACGFSINGKGYVAGGLNQEEGIFLDQFHMYDPIYPWPIYQHGGSYSAMATVEDGVWSRHLAIAHTRDDVQAIGIGIAAPTNLLDIATNNRTGLHPENKALYVTTNSTASSDGVEFRNSNGTQGIGFGFNTMYAAGSNENQDLGLKPKGNGILKFQTGQFDRMRIQPNGMVSALYGFEVWSPNYDVNVIDIKTGNRTGTHPNNLLLYGTREMAESGGGLELRTADGFFGMGIGKNSVYNIGGLPLKIKSNEYLSIMTDNVERMRFCKNGKIIMGIGAPFFENADNNFDVTFGQRTGIHAYYSMFYLTGDIEPAAKGFELRTLNGQTGIGIGSNTIYAAGYIDHDLKFQVKTDKRIVFQNQFADFMTVSANGIGIFNPDPKAYLHLPTAFNNRKIVMYETATNAYQFDGFGTTTNALTYQVRSTTCDHIFYAGESASASVELLRIKGNGNVAMAGVIETEAFIAPALINGFNGYGFGYGGPGYSKDKMGYVHLRGVVHKSGSHQNQVVFTLPAAYRPAMHMIVLMPAEVGGPAQVEINSNGDVKVLSATNGYLSLDGVSFRGV